MKNQFFIFAISIFWVMIEFVNNLKGFLPTKNGKWMFQKMRNAVKLIFELMVFFVWLLLFFLDIVDFVFNSG